MSRRVSLAWLQVVCDKYSDAKYKRLLDSVKPPQTAHDAFITQNIAEAADVSFLYCACGTAVRAFRTPHQLACFMCARFLCPDCVVCRCGTAGTLVSDPDWRVGRLTEYAAKRLTHVCVQCDAFFLQTAEYIAHKMRHNYRAAAPVAVSAALHRVLTVAGVGRVLYNGLRVEAVFEPYPMRLEYAGTTVYGTKVSVPATGHLAVQVTITPFFTEHSADIVCASSVSHHAVPSCRPVCYASGTGVSAAELHNFAEIASMQFGSDMTYLAFYVPGSTESTAFCFLLIDKPWAIESAVVCSGCIGSFSFKAFAAHVQISEQYILDTAVRVRDGEFFRPGTTCSAFAHGCQLALELRQTVERNWWCHLPGRMSELLGAGATIYGVFLYPTLSRRRFIGIRVTETAIECAVCSDRLAGRAGHTATSILHPIALHWNVGPDVVATFCKLIGSYEIGPEMFVALA